MEVANPNIIVAGIFIATLVVIGSIAAALSIMGAGNRQVQQRLDRLRDRFSPTSGGAQARARSIKLNAPSSGFEAVVRELIPRPAELKTRLGRTGKAISLGQYAMISAGVAITSAVGLGFFLGLPPFLALFCGLILGIGGPHMVVGKMIDKRLKKFTASFPEAIDLIVRGLKSGLPITESISVVGREIADPVGVEFRRVADGIRLGKTLEEALWDTADRLDTPDFRFFVISLSVQRETGGNLGETLSNLSDILRKRHQMKLKIKAMSSEGRASAMIIGALPFVMFGLILAINFEYASVLYTDPRAMVIAIGGLMWMGLGMFIIQKMINFEI